MKITALVAVSLGSLLVLGAFATPGADEGRLRVGVFDSRAVAIAFAASPQHAEFLKGIRDEYECAKQTGDEGRVREIDAEMRMRQARMHQQGFSTAPVDDLLEWIEDELPSIAERAGVDLIVSRWRVAYRRPEAELVDVTRLLIEPFAPNEEVLRNLAELDEHEPLSLYDTDWEAMERH